MPGTYVRTTLGGVPHVKYNGYAYATMDKCDPSAYWSASKSCGAQCQRTHIAMPAGWSLVPYSADVVSNVAAKNNFHTHVLVFGNGKAYGTKSYSNGRLFGWSRRLTLRLTRRRTRHRTLPNS